MMDTILLISLNLISGGMLYLLYRQRHLNETISMDIQEAVVEPQEVEKEAIDGRKVYIRGSINTGICTVIRIDKHEPSNYIIELPDLRQISMPANALIESKDQPNETI